MRTGKNSASRSARLGSEPPLASTDIIASISAGDQLAPARENITQRAPGSSARRDHRLQTAAEITAGMNDPAGQLPCMRHHEERLLGNRHRRDGCSSTAQPDRQTAKEVPHEWNRHIPQETPPGTGPEPRPAPDWTGQLDQTVVPSIRPPGSTRPSMQRIGRRQNALMSTKPARAMCFTAHSVAGVSEKIGARKPRTGSCAMSLSSSRPSRNSSLSRAVLSLPGRLTRP